MNTATDRVLPTAELRALSLRSDLRGAMQAGLHLALLVGAGWWVAVATGWALAPALLLLGLAQAALFAPIHETVHQTAFRNRTANRVVGWLAATPSLYNWHFYHAFHMAHHRFTQDPARDPELMAPSPATREAWLLRVAGWPYWRLRLRVVRDAWRGDLSAYPYIPERDRATVIRSVRLMTAVLLASVLLSAALFGPWTPVLFWVVPTLLGQPLLRMYLLTEHTGCTMDRNGLTNTRTTLTTLPLRLLMWNMPFHAEHHLYPSIPFHRLGEAHRAIRDRLGVVQAGYARWQLGYWRSLPWRTRA
jgi:fatty acid desaturase